MSESARRSRTTLIIGLALIATLLGSCRGCRHKNYTPPTVQPVAASPAPPLFPNTPAGQAAGAAVQAARNVGPGADAAYQSALQQLRSQGAGAVEVLVGAYRSADPADYGTRKLMVEILAELELPEALPALVEIARTPVPRAERLPDETISPFIEESIIRMAAVGGLGALATANGQAQETLLSLLGSDAAPVREEAARALWMASARMTDRTQREAIRARIPAELRVEPEKNLDSVIPPGANRKLVPRTGK